jgi:hypothetical protein
MTVKINFNNLDDKINKYLGYIEKLKEMSKEADKMTKIVENRSFNTTASQHSG